MIVLHYILDVFLKSVEMLAWSILPCIIITVLMQYLTKSLWMGLGNLIGLRRLVYISSPGVAVHELSHAFFCVIFRHRITKMELFSVGSDGTLGYVNHAYDPGSFYQRIGNFFIGTGPVWGGFTAIYLLSVWLLPSGAQMNTQDVGAGMASFFSALARLDLWLGWRGWLWLYLVIVISANITLSPPDIKGALDGLLAIVIFTFVFTACVLWFYDFPAIFVRHVSQFIITLVPIVVTMLALFVLLHLVLSMIKRIRC